MKKYRFFDFLFLLLPAVAAVIVFVNLNTGSLESEKWDFGFGGVALLVMGAVMIAFYRSIAKFGARWHGYWHSVYYRRKDEPEEAYENGGIDEKKRSDSNNFVPTKTNYTLSLISGIIIYLLGFFAVIIQISKLKS